MYSESCAFDEASVTFKEFDGYVTMLIGKKNVANVSVDLFHTNVKSETLGTCYCSHASQISCLQIRSDSEGTLSAEKCVRTSTLDIQ